MRINIVFLFLHLCFSIVAQNVNMMYSDTSRRGIPFAKDPFVIEYRNNFFMYYSLPSSLDNKLGWGIGIAISNDLDNWKKVGELNPADDILSERKGICAPCAIVRNDTLHLFYQTYGSGSNDAICHAYSLDGINFVRNSSNPIFRPNGEWNCGRAIDAEVYLYKGSYFLYFATRDKSYSKQYIGVATTSENSSFSRGEWKQMCSEPILSPILDWEGNCIEAPSIAEHNGKLFMFYAGNYNNSPQQVGIAESNDGITWKRCSEYPFLKSGEPGSWNSSESGHPCIFYNQGNSYLFYQGNSDYGKTWKLSNIRIKWNNQGIPVIK